MFKNELLKEIVKNVKAILAGQKEMQEDIDKIKKILSNKKAEK